MIIPLWSVATLSSSSVTCSVSESLTDLSLTICPVNVFCSSSSCLVWCRNAVCSPWILPCKTSLSGWSLLPPLPPIVSLFDFGELAYSPVVCKVKPLLFIFLLSRECRPPPTPVPFGRTDKVALSLPLSVLPLLLLLLFTGGIGLLDRLRLLGESRPDG